MITRRQLLTRALRGSSLLAFGTAVPPFVARAAGAVKTEADNVLVVLELTGGNDGLNTVIPYADDLYHKARPTLRQTDRQVIRLDDHVGLNSTMRGFRPLWDQGHLAVVQGVGYPNPQRWHFESMDIWQTADLRGAAVSSRWLGRAAAGADDRSGGGPSCTSARADSHWPSRARLRTARSASTISRHSGWRWTGRTTSNGRVAGS